MGVMPKNPAELAMVPLALSRFWFSDVAVYVVKFALLPFPTKLSAATGPAVHIKGAEYERV